MIPVNVHIRGSSAIRTRFDRVSGEQGAEGEHDDEDTREKLLHVGFGLRPTLPYITQNVNSIGIQLDHLRHMYLVGSN